MGKAGTSEKSNVRVLARCRPFNTREIQCMRDAAGGVITDLRPVLRMDNRNKVTVLDANNNFVDKEGFHFDHCFWSLPQKQYPLLGRNMSVASQEDVFEQTGKRAVQSALKGYHSTIFAYGQTGSGKTYTMMGTDSEPGLIPRVAEYVFSQQEEAHRSRSQDQLTFTVEVSFMEIYNEKVKDLLLLADTKGGGALTSSDYAECRVRFAPEKGTFVEGLTRHKVGTPSKCLSVVECGMKYRTTSSTAMNDTSSRSHAIFQLYLTQESSLGTLRTATLNLVDLAGSERIKASGVTGKALVETKNVNLSLSTLRRVIDVLIDNQKLKRNQRPAVPPFRESMLTWVLSDTFGGNSKTMMIVALSPYKGDVEDTLNTLRYGLKAKALVCNATVNEETADAAVAAMRVEMEALRKELDEKRERDQGELEEVESALDKQQDEILQLQGDSANAQESIAATEAALVEHMKALDEARLELKRAEKIRSEFANKKSALAVAEREANETTKALKAAKTSQHAKEGELAELNRKRETLEQLYNTAQEGEGRAALATEKERLRQLETALRETFSGTGVQSETLVSRSERLVELQGENNALEQQAAQLRRHLAARATYLENLVANQDGMESEFRSIDKANSAMEQELAKLRQTKERQAEAIASQKSKIDVALEQAEKRLERGQAQLRAFEAKFAQEEIRMQSQLDSLRQQDTTLEVELRQKEVELQGQRCKHNAMINRIKILKQRSDAQNAELADLRIQDEHGEERIEKLHIQRKAIAKQRAAADKALIVKRQQMKETNAELEVISLQVSALRKEHGELRDFVSTRFFPVGDAGLFIPESGL